MDHLKAEVLGEARVAEKQQGRQGLCRRLSDRVAGGRLKDGLATVAECLFCIQAVLLACTMKIRFDEDLLCPQEAIGRILTSDICHSSICICIYVGGQARLQKHIKSTMMQIAASMCLPGKW